MPTIRPTTVVPTSTPTIRSIVEQTRPSIVRIDTDDGSGSGFIIQVGFPTPYNNNVALVLTNSHVIDGADSISATVNDRDLFPAQPHTREHKKIYFVCILANHF